MRQPILKYDKEFMRTIINDPAYCHATHHNYWEADKNNNFKDNFIGSKCVLRLFYIKQNAAVLIFK